MLSFAKIQPPSLQLDSNALIAIIIGIFIIWAIFTFIVSDKRRKKIIIFFRGIATGTDLSDRHASMQLLDESNEEKAYRKYRTRVHLNETLGRVLPSVKRIAGILRDCLWMVLVSGAIIFSTYLYTIYR